MVILILCSGNSRFQWKSAVAEFSFIGAMIQSLNTVQGYLILLQKRKEKERDRKIDCPSRQVEKEFSYSPDC